MLNVSILTAYIFQGIIEYWDCESFLLPSSHYVSFTHKTDTDLYVIAKSRSLPTALSISSSGDKFAVMTADRQLQVFDVKKGKLLRAYDESLASFPVTFFIAFPLHLLIHFFFLLFLFFLYRRQMELRELSWWSDSPSKKNCFKALKLSLNAMWSSTNLAIFYYFPPHSVYLFLLMNYSYSTFILCIHCVLIKNNSGPLRSTVICYSLTINSVLFYEHFRKHFYTFWSYFFSISC